MAYVFQTVLEAALTYDVSVAKMRKALREMLEAEQASEQGTRTTGTAGRPPKVYSFDTDILASKFSE